jgi:hypothetical protein
MKTVTHSPADKVVELLSHILAGGMHIKELGKSAHPLVQDTAVAQAWGAAVVCLLLWRQSVAALGLA